MSSIIKILIFIFNYFFKIIIFLIFFTRSTLLIFFQKIILLKIELYNLNCKLKNFFLFKLFYKWIYNLEQRLINTQNNIKLCELIFDKNIQNFRKKLILFLQSFWIVKQFNLIKRKYLFKKLYIKRLKIKIKNKIYFFFYKISKTLIFRIIYIFLEFIYFLFCIGLFLLTIIIYWFYF